MTQDSLYNNHGSLVENETVGRKEGYRALQGCHNHID